MNAQEPSRRGWSGWARVLIAAGVVAVAGGVLVGLLFFDVFKTRLISPEPVRNLRSWSDALQAYYAEHKTYPTDIATVGFSPERSNRYACFSGPGPLEDRGRAERVTSPEARGVGVDTQRFPDRAVTFVQLPEDISSQLGVAGSCPRCSITLACAARLRLEGPLDVWTVSTGERQLSDGTLIPPDEIHHDVDGR